jgi:hypothetical protein
VLDAAQRLVDWFVPGSAIRPTAVGGLSCHAVGATSPRRHRQSSIVAPRVFGMRPFAYWIRIAAPTLRRRGYAQSELFAEASRLWKTLSVEDRKAVAAEAARQRDPRRHALRSQTIAATPPTNLVCALHLATTGRRLKEDDASAARLASLRKRSLALIREAKIRAGLKTRAKVPPYADYVGQRVGGIMKAEHIPLRDAVKMAAYEFAALPACEKKTYGRVGAAKVFAPHEEQMIESLVAKLKGGRAEKSIREIAEASREGKRPAAQRRKRAAPKADAAVTSAVHAGGNPADAQRSAAPNTTKRV